MNEMNEVKGTLTQEEIDKIAGSRTYTYALRYPVEFDPNNPICDVTLRRFKAKDIRKISKVKDNVDQGMLMVEISGNLAPPEVDELDSTDLFKMIEICGVFMTASQV